MNRFCTKAGHTEEDDSVLEASGSRLHQVYFAEQQLLMTPQEHQAAAASPQAL